MELFFIPQRASLLQDLTVTVEGVTLAVCRSARNLNVVLEDQLDFKGQVAAKSQSCRFLLSGGFEHS